MRDSLKFEWVVDTDPNERQLDSLSRFFVENVHPGYISFGEYRAGLAVPEKGWVSDLREKILSQMSECVKRSADCGLAKASASSPEGEALQALAIVRFCMNAEFPYALLEDIVVGRQTKTRGVGSGFLDWIEEECRKRGAKYLSLETGVENPKAARFFRRRGFRPASIVRMKRL